MNGELLSFTPRLLHDGGVTDVADLLDYIELAEAIQARGFVLDAGKQDLMFVRNIFDMAQPVIDQPELAVAESGLDTAAASRATALSVEEASPGRAGSRGSEP